MSTTYENIYAVQDPAHLMQEYKATGKQELRNDLVMHYSYIARSVAMQLRKISLNYAQIEDIVNQGIITLIDCVEKYEDAKGVKFETYAFMRVKGAIIDFVRKQDWLPRRVRKTAKDIAIASEELANQLMREPTHKELAAHLGITVEVLDKHFSEISNSVMISFEGVIQSTVQVGEENNDFGDDSMSPENNLFKKELSTTLAQAVDGLSDKEKLVVSLYYHENLKLNEIAKVLTVTESRVCQIHAKAISKLRVAMETYVKG